MSGWALQVHLVRQCVARVGGWGRNPPSRERNKQLRNKQTYTKHAAHANPKFLFLGRKFSLQKGGPRGLHALCSYIVDNSFHYCAFVACCKHVTLAWRVFLACVCWIVQYEERRGAYGHQMKTGCVLTRVAVL